MAQNKALELSIKIAGKVDKSLMSAIRSAQNSVSSLSASVSRMGTVGLASMGALATGTVAEIISCTKAAASWESSMADVAKVVDGLRDKNGDLTQSYREMSASLLDLSTELPYSAAELAQIAAAGGQSGIARENLMDYTEFAALSGIAFDVEAAQAGQWMANWQQGLGMTQEETETLANQMNYLSNNTNATAAELAEVVDRIGSVADMAGVKTGSLLAMADVMLASGMEAETASTSLRNMMLYLTSGSSATKAQKEVFQRLGFSAQGFAKMMQKDATGAVEDFLNAVQKLPEDIKISTLMDMFGTRSVEGITKLVSNLPQMEKLVNEMGKPELFENSVLNEVIVRTETAEALGAMRENAWNAVKVDFGTAFLPAQKTLTKDMIAFFNQLRQAAPEVGMLAGSLAELAGGGVTALGEAMERSLPHIRRTFAFLSNNTQQVVTVLGGLVAAFGAMKLAPAIEGLVRDAGGLLFGSGGGEGWKRKPGVIGTVKGWYQHGQNAPVKVFQTVSDGFQAARIGAEMANSSMTRHNGEKITASGRSGLIQTLSDAAAGAWFGFRDRKTLSDKSVSDKKWWKNAMKTAEQITSAKERGGALGMVRDAVMNSHLGKAGTALLGGTGIVPGILRGTKAIGKTTLEVLSNIAGPGGLGLTTAAGAVLGAARSGAGWVVGKAGTLAGMAAGSRIGQSAIRFAGMAAPGISRLGGLAGAGIGRVGRFAGAGLGMLNSVTGFGGMMAGALPVVGVLSAGIAAVSMLGDKFGGLEGILSGLRTTLFGTFDPLTEWYTGGLLPGGLATELVKPFDSLSTIILNTSGLIQGLFQENGVANALSGVRKKLFGEYDPFTEWYTGGFFSAKTATMLVGPFDGAVQIVQALIDVLGQLINFSVETVKPMLGNAFQFIGGVVIPALLQAFTNAAPIIAQIVIALGGGVMTGMQIVGAALEWVLPIIALLVTEFLNVANAVLPVLLTGFLSFSESVGVIMESIKGVFEGLMKFLNGTFSGDWSLAWDGIVQIFGNAFNGLKELCKVPINAVITLINGAISGINALGITIPEWVPEFGGQTFGINIPEIPMLARGGFTNGVSIAGEAGTEAVISFLPSVRSANINTWIKAGRMLGVDNTQAAQAAGGYQMLPAPAQGTAETLIWMIPGIVYQAIREIRENHLRTVELRKVEKPERDDPNRDGGTYTITYSPTIIIQGDADRDEVERILQEDKDRFDRWWEEKQRKERRVRFA